MNSLPLQLLLADDDDDDRTLFAEALEELNVFSNFKTVNDGEQLMHRLNNMNQLPDILFLDLNMPRKNGMECLFEIKSSARFKELRVVIFSTSFDEHIVKKLHNYGANFYIRKPNQFSSLKKVLQQVISVAPHMPPGNTPFEKFVVFP